MAHRSRQACVVLPKVPENVSGALAMETDGLDRPLDIVMSAKLQDFKSMLAVSAGNIAVLQKPRGG